MRIAVLTAHQNKIGGAETYIDGILHILAAQGHNLAFCSEYAASPNADAILPPRGCKVFSVADRGVAQCLTSLRDWCPDLLYMHGLENWRWEESVLKLSPAICYAHGYYGTCISGSKTHLLPAANPCEKKFGAACLAHFYPRRCGGLNPVTMWEQFQIQSQRLRLLHRYRAVLTNSEHMAREFQKHGVRAECLYLFSEDQESREVEGQLRSLRTADNDCPWRLLYLGRMSRLKGGELLLEALAGARKNLDRDLHVVFAGSGPDRSEWEGKAKHLQASNPGIVIEFVGWVDAHRRFDLLNESDLLVFPSVWPEPFGLGGIEAGLQSVPCVGFAVGGIPEWLTEGVNGCLAGGDPPSSRSLASAIIRALRDPVLYSRMRDGARQRALEFNRERHVTRLLEVFKAVLNNPVLGSQPSLSHQP